MLVIQGKFDKFTVIKNEDIEKHCSAEQKEQLGKILRSICIERIIEGKRTDNTYIVVNTDEPYAEEIVEIMKRNNHWD